MSGISNIFPAVSHVFPAITNVLSAVSDILASVSTNSLPTYSLCLAAQHNQSKRHNNQGFLNELSHDLFLLSYPFDSQNRAKFNAVDEKGFISDKIHFGR